MAFQLQIQRNGHTTSKGQYQILLMLLGITVLGFGIITLVVLRGYRNRLAIFINCLCHTLTMTLVLAGFLLALKSNRYPEDRAMRTDASLNARRPRRNFSWEKPLLNETDSKKPTMKIASSSQKTMSTPTGPIGSGKNIIDQNDSVGKKSTSKAESQRQNSKLANKYDGQNETFAMDRKTQEKESLIKLGAWNGSNDNNDNNKGEYAYRDHLGTDDDYNKEHGIYIGRKYFKILGVTTAIPATLGFIAFLVIA